VYTTWLFGSNYASGKLVAHLSGHAPQFNIFNATIALALKLNSLSLSPLHYTMSRFHPASLVDPQNHTQELLDFFELDAQDRCLIGEFAC